MGPGFRYWRQGDEIGGRAYDSMLRPDPEIYDIKRRSDTMKSYLKPGLYF